MVKISTTTSNEESQSESSFEQDYKQEPETTRNYSNQYNDPNTIKITIADEKTPIIVLFGSSSCGKTMTLVRLTRFLNKRGYKIGPVTSFRDSDDSNYKQRCDEFNNMIQSDSAAGSTSMIDFMLVEVYNSQRRKICQILEAPGEHYFDPANPSSQFPTYINRIISNNNRKIWLTFIEPDKTSIMKNQTVRNNYVSKIEKLKQQIHPRDKILFLFNKVDETNYVIRQGQVNLRELIKYTANIFQGIFEPFRNTNPITKLWKRYNCDLIAFQSGTYTEAINGEKQFQEGSDVYPAILWQKILSIIKG